MSRRKGADAHMFICRSYNDLIAAMRSRAIELGLNNATLDRLAGVPSGYAGKVLGQSKVKRLGFVSLEAMLGALGLQIQLTEDADATKRILKFAQRSDQSARMRSIESIRRRRHGPLSQRTISRAIRLHMRKIRALGNLAYRQKVSPRRRSQIARRAARARWRQGRAAAIKPSGEVAAPDATAPAPGRRP